ncbi:AAA family ATPase [Paenibacillus sp. PK4536]|uniref:AAA family ATPase n=1 Tax=Paenibacillus sp. PK4536 TaxID=3024576 RepID=UPI0023587174|nr:AAA family ATPase [Paenibacillus sp. PK4536]WIM37966.1 AAA family ATPase [Paenibacillus sp. PK4536]
MCINVLNFNIVEELKEILDKIKENQPNKKKSFIIKFLKSYIHKIFKEIITVNEEIININEQTVESIIKELHVIKHFDDQAYLEEICDKLSKMLLKRLLKTDFKKLYIDKENTHLKLYDKAYKEFICFFNKIDERLIEDNIEFEFTKHFEYIKEFSKLYDKYVSKESGYIHADFSNLSTGEEDIINLFSVIYHAINIQTLKNNKHVTILLDEPNNFMHPEWSRKLIFILLEFLKDVSNKSKQKYTIICTTHSPFLLSDLHTNQIIALDTNKEKKVVIKSNLEKTFASNIHTLFSDSFFMETTIGEFARQKINFLIKRLNDDNSNKDKKLSENEKRDFKYIIELMGEPLIALKLNEMYMKAIKDDQESKNNLLEENIKLKEYIKKLEVRELENRFRRSDENDKNL